MQKLPKGRMPRAKLLLPLLFMSVALPAIASDGIDDGEGPLKKPSRGRHNLPPHPRAKGRETRSASISETESGAGEAGGASFDPFLIATCYPIDKIIEEESVSKPLLKHESPLLTDDMADAYKADVELLKDKVKHLKETLRLTQITINSLVRKNKERTADTALIVGGLNTRISDLSDSVSTITDNV